MDFEPEFIVEDTYWCFGVFAKKNGTIDYNQLKKDLEQIEYYIAAIDLKTANGDYFGRLCQKCGYRWILENIDDSNDDCSECFNDFVKGSVFEQFTEQALILIQRGFNALSNILKTTPDELRKNGIDVEQVENIVSMSNAIIKKTSMAFEHPVQKLIN